MATKRQNVTLEEPQQLQKLRLKIDQLNEEKRTVKNEISIRKNKTRQFFLGGVILGGIILLSGIVLVFIK